MKILVHPEQLFVGFANKKDSIKARRLPFTPIHLHPYITSYKQDIHAILDQNLQIYLGIQP